MLKSKVEEGVTLEGENVGNLSRAEVQKKVREIAEKRDRKPMNARIDHTNWDVVPEIRGYKVNKSKTVRMVMQAGKGEQVRVSAIEKDPPVTAEMLKKDVDIISEYSTPIIDGQTGRVNNIEIAIERINTKILNPGDVFSFNDVTGKRTEEKGYEEAPIIVGDHKEMATGGGVCQLSSTLFNAAELAGLTIIERHTHSKPVGYVPPGRDATVTYGSRDLKFSNSRSHPVMIRAQKDGDRVRVWIIENRTGGK